MAERTCLVLTSESVQANPRGAGFVQVFSPLGWWPDTAVGLAHAITAGREQAWKHGQWQDTTDPATGVMWEVVCLYGSHRMRWRIWKVTNRSSPKRQKSK